MTKIYIAKSFTGIAEERAAFSIRELAEDYLLDKKIEYFSTHPDSLYSYVYYNGIFELERCEELCAKYRIICLGILNE